MIDHDDVDSMWIVSMLGGSGWVWAVLSIIAFVVLAFIASANDDECAKKHCDNGAPILMHHECLCADKAK